MAKGRDKGGREPKKPKADKKPTQAASTFLRPQPVAAKPTAKDSAR
jgi:hypothetical protein